MSGATDSGMVRNMVVIMGAVTLLALCIGFASRIFGVGGVDSDDPIMRNALISRIEPVGSVRTSADDLSQASAVMAVATGPKSAEELVNGACAACHAESVAAAVGAPMIGDEAAWATRRELGLEALVASVVNGKGAMPARGGSTYTDDEIALAVQQMALFEPSDSDAPAAADTSESSAVETTDKSETIAVAAADTSESSAVPTTDTSESTPVAAAEVEPLVLGQVPEGLTDKIKASVDGVCAGCHISGVGNAPKFGDKEAWQSKADKGMAALVASVINGLNVMPPRGASNLTDEEIPIAIQYMMSK